VAWQALTELARASGNARPARAAALRSGARRALTGGRAYGYTPARDSATGQVEINETEAAVVRRVFELYADGMSPRGIASLLNDEQVPSPGAKWKRVTRRGDGKWLASAIHGDVNRGTGILNNRRYVGVVSWGRSEWKRSAADSVKRRQRLLGTRLA
jgi:hypothetical protein